MPPNTAHAVFTPVASFTRGGHFYRYNNLRHTAVARRTDKSLYMIATNEHHTHTFEVLLRMVLSLPKLNRSTSFFALLSTPTYRYIP